MCRLLRVLNAIRDPKIGLPLTFTQYPFRAQLLSLKASVHLSRLLTPSVIYNIIAEVVRFYSHVVQFYC